MNSSVTKSGQRRQPFLCMLFLVGCFVIDSKQVSLQPSKTTAEEEHNGVPRQFDTVIGASPFGEDLRHWLKLRSTPK
jgi:hypothetical protein